MTRIKHIKEISPNYSSTFIVFLGKQLIVPEYCITKLGQNDIPPSSDSIILNDKKIHFWTTPIYQLLITPLFSYCEETTDNENLDNKMLLIYIVIGGGRGQGKFRSACKFILRNKEGYNKDSYVIKNGHIYCIKDKYKIFQK